MNTTESIMGGLITIVFILAFFTDFFDNIFSRRRK
jgi:hypothetical protein